MKCFVTVGTTSFDGLIDTLNQERIQHLLSSRFNVKELVIQFGRGTLKPTPSSNLTVSSYDFKPDLREDMNNADIVISHAGAGSIMEALRLKKRLIVVVNDELMDNHQQELASALEQKGYLLFASTPDALESLLLKTPPSFDMKTYPPVDRQAFSNLLVQTGV